MKLIFGLLGGLAMSSVSILFSNPDDDKSWLVAGFENIEQVNDGLQNIRLASTSASIDPIKSMLLEFPIAINCWERGQSKAEPSFVEAQGFGQFQNIWSKLVETNEHFDALKSLQYDDLSFNSYGASTPSGTIWFSLIGKEKLSEHSMIYAINSFEFCDTLSNWKMKPN